MSGYPENFDGAARPPVTDEQIRVARAKVALPATFLILNALLGIVVFGAVTGLHVGNPLLTNDLMKKWVTEQPDSAEKEKALKALQDSEDDIRANPEKIKGQLVRNAAIMFATNSLAILGAVLLRLKNSRGWGYASSIISMIPLATGCCCTGLPFGLWGVLMLGQASVADGLDAARRKAANPNPDGY